MGHGSNRPNPTPALAAACAAAGLDATNATLLHHYSNAIYVLPAEHAVARVTTGLGAPTRVRHAQAITRWLVDEQRFPATRPLRDVDPVALDAACVISFWVYYPPPATAWRASPAQLADLLRRLHRVPPPLPTCLSTWVPLMSLEDTVEDPSLSAALNDDERRWIQTRIAEVRDRLTGLDWPLGTGLIHADAWAGNLLPHASAGLEILLGDWDWVSVGPREVDLVPTWHAAARYGKGRSWIEAFADRYGYDLASWDGYRTLMNMRDLVQLTGPIRRAHDAPKYLAALRQRLDSLQSGDTRTVWTAL